MYADYCRKFMSLEHQPHVMNGIGNEKKITDI